MDSQTSLYVCGTVISLLLGVVGYLVKDKLSSILEQVKGLRDDLRRLFEREEQNARDIVAIKGEINTINERCGLLHPKGVESEN